MMRTLFSVTAVVLLSVNVGAAYAEPAERPNVLLIMADDLGYADLGCYGGEIQTPHLDSLAENGLRFTSFYNTARCWPTRAALLTGYYAQQVRRDQLPNAGGGGGAGGNRNRRPEWAQLVPEILSPSGYRCYHSGKWHLDGKPLQNGFHRSYLLQDQGRFFSPKQHSEDDQPLPAVAKDSGFYGTTAIADHALKCLRDHHQHHSTKPFFHYLAFTAPHFPLHALPQDIAKYQDVYQVGWEAVRAARYQRQQQLGLHQTALSPFERELGPPYSFPEHLRILGSSEVNRPLPWGSLTADQQAFQAAKMALHAAMVDRMDQEIGRVLKQLTEMRALHNTLILFLSDNGASAEIMVRDDGHDPQAVPGSAETYLCLGPGWSTASNTPFRRHKTWVHEGGISTPLIAHWPAGISAKGQLRHNAGHVIDLVPTVLDVCQVTVPSADAESSRNDRPPQPAPDENDERLNGALVPIRPGISLKPVFAEDGSADHKLLWWLHDGHRAIRMGDWKLVSAKGEPWSLHNLKTDRAEQHDLAKQHPDVVQTLTTAWQQKVDEFRTTLEAFPE